MGFLIESRSSIRQRIIEEIEKKEKSLREESLKKAQETVAEIENARGHANALRVTRDAYFTALQRFLNTGDSQAANLLLIHWDKFK